MKKLITFIRLPLHQHTLKQLAVHTA